jgi:hypothetical protein
VAQAASSQSARGLEQVGGDVRASGNGLALGRVNGGGNGNGLALGHVNLAKDLEKEKDKGKKK